MTVKRAVFLGDLTQTHVDWGGQELVIRLHDPLAPEAIERINREFSDMFVSQPLRAGGPLRQEKNEPELFRLPRLISAPRRRAFGRLRALIDAINRADIVRGES